jgi:hypothetical protein
MPFDPLVIKQRAKINNKKIKENNNGNANQQIETESSLNQLESSNFNREEENANK